MSSSYSNFINDSLDIERKNLKQRSTNTDLYKNLLHTKILPESIYTVIVREKSVTLPKTEVLRLKLNSNLQDPNKELAIVTIIESNHLKTNVDTYMFYNTRSRFELNKQYRVQGLLMLFNSQDPLLGYSSRGTLIPPRLLGENQISWKPEDSIIPPYRIQTIPKPLSREYYKNRYNLNILSPRSIKPIDLQGMCNNLSLEYLPEFKTLSDYRIYPFIQVICSSQTVLDSYYPVFDYIFGTWGTFNNPLEVTMYSSMPSNKGKTWIRLTKTKQDLYPDIPTIDLYS